MHFTSVSFSTWVFFLYLLILSTNVPAKLTSHSSHSIIIDDVITNIDISSQLVKMKHRISLVPGINNLRSFVYHVDPSLVDNVANITATTGYRMNEYLRMKYHNKGIWEVFFTKSLHQNEPEVVQVSVIFTRVLKPFPSRVTQYEKHLVLYSGPISLYSPYLILNHTTYVNTGDGALHSVIIPSDFELINKSPLTFISLNISQENYIKSNAKIHYEHLNVFLTVKMLYRTIEVSHWGSISVTETIELKHSGARFYGPFHRQLQETDDGTAISSIVTFLPASASDISVYDDIGNISSTRLIEHFDCIEMKFSPRFLLYGGWKVKYILEYTVPSYEYLYNEGNEFILKMRLIDHIFNDMLIDVAIVKVILPEGSETIGIKTPYAVQNLNDSYHVSYLDTIGRPVVSFIKENLVEEHIQDFVLNYKFSKYKMLFEPFYVVLFLEVMFIIFIIFNRLDFSITQEDEKKPDKSVCESIVPVMKVNNTSCYFKSKKKRH